jgi:hypothetical protein
MNKNKNGIGASIGMIAEYTVIAAIVLAIGVFIKSPWLRWPIAIAVAWISAKQFKDYLEDPVSKNNPYPALIVTSIYGVLALVEIPFHAIIFLPAVGVVFIVWLLYGDPVERFQKFYAIDPLVAEELKTNPLLSDDPILRQPAPGVSVQQYEDAVKLLPKDSTFGTPGYGVAMVDKFEGRGAIGAKGERILAGMLQESGILSVPNVVSFWSMKSPDDRYDIDVDCMIRYGRRTWIIDAKYYVPERDHDYLREHWATWNHNKSYLQLVHMNDPDWKGIRDIRDTLYKNYGDVDKVYDYLDEHAESKTYDLSHSDEISRDAIVKTLGRNDPNSVKAYIALVPTSKGIPGVLKGTKGVGGIPIDHASEIINEIKRDIDEHPEFMDENDLRMYHMRNRMLSYQCAGVLEQALEKGEKII